MPRGTNTVIVLRPFTCYRDPGVGPVSALVDGKQTTIQGPTSGPRTNYETGVVVTDATDEEVENWTAAELVKRKTADAPSIALPAPQPDDHLDQ